MSDQLKMSDQTNTQDDSATDKTKLFGDLYNEGIKFKISGDFEHAAAKLGEATELCVELYGQFSEEAFLPHYQYGIVLLEIARNEVMEIEVSKIHGDNHEHKEESKSGDTHEQKNFQDDKTCDGENSEGASSDEETGVPTSMELSWESLEVARKICERLEESKEWKNKKGDVLVALAECSMADDKFEIALSDLQEALEIRLNLFGSDDRMVAEVYYHMGHTYKNLNDFAEAAAHFQLASNSIKAVIDSITLKVSTSADESEKPALIESLKSLNKIKSELEELIQDAKESDQAMKEKQEQLQRALTEAFIKSNLSSMENKAGEADDLTSMIRKAVKRGANGSNAVSSSNETAGTNEGLENGELEPTVGKKPKN